MFELATVLYVYKIITTTLDRNKKNLCNKSFTDETKNIKERIEKNFKAENNISSNLTREIKENVLISANLGTNRSTKITHGQGMKYNKKA